jgi:parallel beta-helix repeat protein
MSDLKKAKWFGVLVFCMAAAVAGGATVTVTDYGVLGNDNEADSLTNVAAFDAAIAAAGEGGTLLFPDGVYYIEVGLGMLNNTTYKATGPSGATIKRISTGTQALSLLSPGRGCTIEGLTFDGNRSSGVPAWSYGINVEFGDDVLIKDCTVKNNPFDGIQIANNRHTVTVDGCTIINNYRQGIAITNAGHGCVIRDCYFNGNAGGGVDFEPDVRHTDNHTVSGCYFDDEFLQNIGSSHFPWNITIEDCNFVGPIAGIVGMFSMNIVANNNTFAGGADIKFNSGNGTSGDDGIGKITLSGNTGLTNDGINLLTNPSFDSWASGDPVGWTKIGGATIEQETTRVIEGSSAAHLTASSDTAILRQTLSVTANEYYTFGGYIQTDGQKHYNPLNDPLIRVEFLDGSSTMVADIKLHGYYDNMDYHYYEKIMGIAKAPAGAVQARVSVGLSGETFDAYYDGLFFYHGIGPDGGDLTTSQVRYRFDFEPPYRIYDDADLDSRFTMPEYVHADPDDLYDSQVGYGFATGGALISRRRFAFTNALLGVDFVKLDTDGYFALDVPNGRYLVTFAGGDFGYNTRMSFEIQDVLYGMDFGAVIPAGAPLYALDFNSGQKTLDMDRDDLNMGSQRVYIYANDPTECPDCREVLYLHRAVVDVTDGQLRVSSNGAGDCIYNWLEVVPAPQTTCEERILAGLNMKADISGDCRVDFRDVRILSQWWLNCNDPTDLNCSF